MKRFLTISTLALSLMMLASLKNTASAQPGAEPEVSYQTFYDDLDPYGRWIDNPDYGYVWVPDAGPDFRPYSTNGHWVWSDDYEWMWVSDYEWGWAPFHYGRWMEDPYYGWVWVPGYEWSPAWVAWRDGGDYYGWAPLRPGFNIGINISLGGYNPPVDYWCFAPRQYITSPRIYDYCVPRYNNVTIINSTTIINNYNYNRNVFRTGPGRSDAERYTGRIESVRFRDASGPGRSGFRNNEVSIYRPRVGRDNNRSFAPRKFEHYDRSNGNGNRGNQGVAAGGRRNDGFGRNDNRNSDGAGRERNRPSERQQVQQPANPNNLPTPDRRNGGFGRNDNRNSDGAGRERNRPLERQQVQQPANPNNLPTPDRRNGGFGRNDNQNNDGAGRERSRPFERREMQQPTNPGNDRMQQRRDVFERRDMQQPQQRQSAPRMEQRRQEQPQQPRQQEQPRQFQPRNDNGGGGNRGGGDNNGGNHGGGRRGR